MLKNGPPLPTTCSTHQCVGGRPEEHRRAGTLARRARPGEFRAVQAAGDGDEGEDARRGLSAIDHLLNEAREALALPGKAFIVPQLRAWIHVNAADDRELAGERSGTASSRRRSVQHGCRGDQGTEKGNPRRVSLGSNKQALYHPTAGPATRTSCRGSTAEQNRVAGRRGGRRTTRRAGTTSTVSRGSGAPSSKRTILAQRL